ncbi:MAG TPA: RidA family protein, partial [Rhizomicrobium sp.]|nr:RidA family protein [Rhizomicrobium sp.]
LKGLGLTLPSPPTPVASYVPFTISGHQVLISGQIPVGPEGVRFAGKLGAEIPLEDGKEAARLCALNLIAQLKAACGGDLDRVKRCLRLGVFVNATPDFTQHPEVANGASDFIVAALGEAGKHARAAVGAGSLPRGVAVEVEGLFEID